jgi:hypothetical protein
MKPECAAERWEMLQARAHLPKVQDIIRGEIGRGTIRVVPAPSGGIRIIPARGASPTEAPDFSVDRGLEKDETNTPVLDIERMTQ